MRKFMTTTAEPDHIKVVLWFISKMVMSIWSACNLTITTVRLNNAMTKLLTLIAFLACSVFAHAGFVQNVTVQAPSLCAVTSPSITVTARNYLAILFVVGHGGGTYGASRTITDTFSVHNTYVASPTNGVLPYNY